MASLQTQILWMKRARTTLISITLIALVAFYFFPYRAATERLRALQAQTSSRQAELRDNLAKSSIKTEIAAKNERLKQELERIRKPSKESDFSQLVKDLTACAQQSGVRQFDYKIGMPTRSDLFMEQQFSLTCEGDALSVFNFLRSVEDMQRLTRVRSMSVKTVPEKNGSGAGRVQASVSLNVYFSTE